MFPKIAFKPYEMDQTELRFSRNDFRQGKCQSQVAGQARTSTADPNMWIAPQYFCDRIAVSKTWACLTIIQIVQ